MLEAACRHGSHVAPGQGTRPLKRADAVLRLVTLLCCVLMQGCPSTSSTSSGQACSTDYWVSTSGNDNSTTGSAAAPFKTIDRARLAVQADPSRGQCVVTVNIQAGTYPLQNPIVFDQRDSGADQREVVYRASGGPVVLSGGIEINGFVCLVNVCVASVASLPGNVMPRQFYVNGTRAIRARSNYGQEVNLDYTRVANGYNQIIPQSFTHPELVEVVTVTQWKMMRCPVGSLSGTTLVMKTPCWDNANTYPVPWNFQLLSWLENAPEFLTTPNMWYLDPFAGTITYLNANSGQPQNAVLPLLETLVRLEGVPGSPVSHIRFEGLTFSYATWMQPNGDNGYVADQSGNFLQGTYNANPIGHHKIVYQTPGNVTLKYASHITFSGNTFTHLGGVALDLDIGSQDNRIIENTFTDISSTAIQVGGVSQEDMRPTDAQATRNNLINNNDISYTGQDYYDSAAVYVGFTNGTIVTHNTINHTPWTGIAIGWGWGLFDQGGFPGLPHATFDLWGSYTTPTIAGRNEISSNRISHFLEKLWDGGAIYTNGAQGQDFADGLIMKLNVAENKNPSAGGNTFYTDGGSRYITLEQNVSLNNPTGTVNFGPCLTGSSIDPLCAGTGLVSYGADMGGCLPVGDLIYKQNYLLDPIEFFGPQLCQNPLIPPYPVNLTFINNIPTTSAAQVPQWILDQAGRQP